MAETRLARIDTAKLAACLQTSQPPLLIDVRRRAAFVRKPRGIATALPLYLDAEPPQIPNRTRDTPIVLYCLCTGQASSTRAALWLLASGYTQVPVLQGGLPQWEAEGRSLAVMDLADQPPGWMAVPQAAITSPANTPLLAETAFLAGQSLPLRRDMAVLFVDMVDSTSLLLNNNAEKVLALVQTFMATVVDVAAHHCGDVHDFDGDGALLYFAGPGEALPAAFALRAGLAAARQDMPELPQARFALDVGPLVIGYVGTHFRRGLSFIGPSINRAARILALAPANGIVVTEAVLTHAQRSDPDLHEQFIELGDGHLLKGFGESSIRVFFAD